MFSATTFDWFVAILTKLKHWAVRLYNIHRSILINDVTIVAFRRHVCSLYMYTLQTYVRLHGKVISILLALMSNATGVTQGLIRIPCTLRRRFPTIFRRLKSICLERSEGNWV